MIRPVRSDGRIETGGVFVPIVRRRVIDRIGSAAMQRVVLIVAPAGYGKSVALTQYLEATKDSHIRFDVPTDGNTLLGFLRGFADALHGCAPDARATLAGAYEKNAGSQNAGSDLALWMHSHLKSYRGLIAIDDLHVGQEDREVARFLSALIERTKGRVQWIIATRSTIGLPIGTWLAYGESDLAVDEHDLKFSVEEAKEAARAFRLGVRDEELHDLLHLTDGWATAMSFALRSSTRSIDLRSISTMTREMIYRYLAEQVYAMLGNEERRFIETAALLPEIDTGIMVAAGFDRAGAMIEELRQRVAFIHEQPSGAYRLHDLFREFIQHELSLQGSQVAAERRIRLGSIYLERGQPHSALTLFVESGDVEHMVQLLLAHGLELIARGHGDTVLQALEAIPQPVHAREALLNGLKGILEIGAGRYDSGERFLQRAIRLGDDPAIRSELVLRLAMFLVNQGRDPDNVLASLLEGDASRSAKLEAHAMLAVRCVRAGNLRAAAEHIAVVEDALDTIDDIPLLAKLLQRVGLAHDEAFEPDAAKRCLVRSAELSSSASMWSLASRSYQVLAKLSILADNDVTLSMWYAQQAAAAATKAGDYFDLQTSLLHMLSVETRRGNVDRLQQIDRQLAELRPNDSMRAPYVLASQAHRHAWRGQFDEAARSLSSAKERFADSPDKILVASTIALCLALGGRSQDSARAVEAVLAKLPEGASARPDHGASVYEVATMFCALAEALSSRNISAQRILRRRALYGHQSMVCLRDAVEQLTRAGRNAAYELDDFEAKLEALREFGFGGYARFLVLAAERIETFKTQEVATKPTPSELRIIRALAEGMTTKDIAAEMGRSVYTVQTHIQNLIEKLGCHGRAEAVAAARRLGYLEDAL